MVKIDKKFLILFAAVSLIFLIASFHYYNKTVQEGHSISFVDFRVYYYAGFRLEMNENIYDARDGYFSYKYSPIFALIMSIIKFSNPTPAQALCVWYIILFVSFILCLYLTKEILFSTQIYIARRFFDILPFLFIFRYLILINFTRSYLPVFWPLPVKLYDQFLLYILLPLYLLSLFFRRKITEEKHYIPTMSIAILFVLKSLILNIDRAQVNIVILVLLLFFAYYLINKRETTAGIYLGIGMIFKVTPVIFLIYLLVKNRVKAFFTAVATFLLFLIMPVFKWGIQRNTELIMNWVRELKATIPTEYLQHKNQSLIAAISRFFSKNSDIALWKLSDSSLSILIIFIYLSFMCLLIYLLARKRKRPDSHTDIIYDLSLVFIAMTILSPVGHKAAFIYIMLPLCILIKKAFERHLKDRFLNGGLLAYASLTYLNSSDIIGDFSITLHKYSLMMLSLFLIFLLIVHERSAE